MTLIKKELDANSDKYGNWVKRLIEPSSFNDARLFALETQVKEEEEIRFAQLENFKDLMRKLVYTFEQERAVDGQGQSSFLPAITDVKGQSSELPPLSSLHKVSQSVNFGSKLMNTINVSPDSEKKN